MKKMISLLLAALFCASCNSQGGLSGDPTATFLGAQVGGMMGQIIGDSSHGYRGAMLGSLIGTVTGAVVANAVTTPSKDEYTISDEYNRAPSSYTNVTRTSDLAIRNIRFVDDNRSHSLEPEETAKIIFEVVNNGQSDAYRVTPVVKEVNGNKQIYLSASAGIEVIPAGDGIRYTANIRTGKRLRGDAAQFQISVIEADGAMVSSRIFAIPINR